jgi:E3 ubiquitin-protein ligase HUWE1
MVGITRFTQIVFTDKASERTTQHTLHTVLLVSLNRIGGIKSIFDIGRSFMSSIERALAIKEEDRTEVQKEESVHAYGGLKVTLHLIHPLISSKPLFEAGQTSFLNIKERGRNDDFDPHDLLVILRLAAFPLLRDLWNSSWLVLTPLSVCKSVVQTVLELLTSDGEEPSPSASSPGEAPPTRQGPDENRIRQLTDMGFPRASVERALLRAHNNVAAATDLLLSQPFLLMGDPEPAEQNIDTDSHGDQDSDDAEPGPWELAARDAASTSEASTVTPEARRKELAAAREEFTTSMPHQALRLLDDHSSLMFDVHSVFTVSGEGTQERSINLLIDDITTFSPAAYDVQEQPLAVRCRLLAVIFGEVQPLVVRKTAIEGKKLMDTLLALLLSGPSSTEEGYTTPSWLAAHLLLTEALLILAEEPRKISLPKPDENLESDSIPKEELLAGPPFTDARSILFDFCYRLLSLGTISRDEQLSCLRLLVVLTRDQSFATELVKRGGIDLLLKCLRTKADPFTLAGPHSYITTILRHIIEDKSTLEHIMQREIKRFISHPRTRPVDPLAFVRSCSAMALRDPAVFADATIKVAQLHNPLTSIQNIGVKKDNQEAKSGAHNTEASKDGDMQIDEQQVTNTVFPESLESVVHFLIAELMRMAKQGSDQLIAVPPNPPSSLTDPPAIALQAAHTSATAETAEHSSANKSEGVNNYTYTCFLMQALTELLFSYESCKLAFLSYSPKKRSQSTKDTKFRTTALNFFLSDLVSFGTLDAQPTPEARRRIILCNWAMSVLVALCVDPAGGHDLKDVPADLVSVRKFVIEAISRSIKDLPLTASIESRYARLLAITDLCYRFLTVRFGPGIRKTPDEIPTHISKVMLEKNFVASLTTALGDIDLNYPNVRTVVTSVLKPLEYL